MRDVLRAPLVPGALVALAVAVANQLSPPLALVVGAALTAGAATLAFASADRPRRLCWTTAAVLGLIACGGVAGAPIAPFDLRHAGPLDGMRELLSEPLRRLIPEPEGGIVRGIVLGERADVDADLAAAFARTGTAHLLAISGFNMTLVATGVGILVRGRAPHAATAAITALTVIVYSVLVGLAPSVVRAALMATVAACGIAFGRRAATVNALALAIAAMLAVDPSAIADVGFLLSATATAGLLFLSDPLSRGLAPLPKAVREGLATTLAATLPTVPIIAAVFGRVSVVSPLANLVAVPLFPPLMIAGAATSAVGAVWIDLAQLPALATYGLAFALRQVVEVSAGVPIASVAVPDGPVAGALYAAAIASTLYWGRRAGPRFALAPLRAGLRAARARLTPLRFRVRRASAVVAVALLTVVAALAALVLGDAGPPIRLHALDVGQGDAFLVEVSGRMLLVDGGPDPARLLAELGATLPPWRRRIDVVALTHAHADHANGLFAVLERYEVGLAIEPIGLNPGPVADAWQARGERRQVIRRAVGAGARVRIGDATLSVLSPEDDPDVDVPSLVLKLEHGSFSILFMGDATEKAQADLLLRPELLRARVYVPPHHGAATPYGRELVEAVRPQSAVISVGARNRYGHPTPETLAALGRIPTYRTDRDGTVELDPDGTQLVVRTHANGLPAPRGGSLPHAPPAR